MPPTSSLGTTDSTRASRDIHAKELSNVSNNIFEHLFNSLPDGAIITDNDGNITHLNYACASFLHLDPQSVLGKHCTEVIKNSRMHLVAKTGKSETSTISHINGQKLNVHTIPIYKNNTIIAVYEHMKFNRAPRKGLPTNVLDNTGNSISHQNQMPQSLKQILNQTEKDAICRALEQSGQNKTKAAELLGIHRTQLYKKMKKLSIQLST